MDRVELARLHAEYVVKLSFLLSEAEQSGLSIETLANDAVAFCRLQDHSHD